MSSNDGSKTYILGTGKGGAERLELQNKYISENAYKQLAKAGLREGQIVWDIGCGNGIVTEYLAKAVGNSGHVYALDISKEQLALAEERIKSAGLKNVTFVHGDISSEEISPKSQADIVYVRFVLMHLRDPQIAVRKIKDLLKAGGVVASHEAVVSSGYALCRNDPIRKYMDTLLAFGKYNGVDYDMGDHLEDLFNGEGYSKVSACSIQQAFPPSDAKRFILLSYAEWKDKAINCGIITAEKADSLETELRNLPEGEGEFYYPKGVFAVAWK